MSTNSSLIKASNAFERLFRILGKVFLIMTIVLAILGSFVVGYSTPYLPGGSLDRYVCIIYIMSPAIITLVLTVAAYVAAGYARNFRFELPAEIDKN